MKHLDLVWITSGKGGFVEGFCWERISLGVLRQDVVLLHSKRETFMSCRVACRVCGCVLFTISCFKEKSSVSVWGGGQSAARQGNLLLCWKEILQLWGPAWEPVGLGIGSEQVPPKPNLESWKRKRNVKALTKLS